MRHAITLGLSAGMFVLLLLLAIVVIVLPKVAGATALTILTSSMEPTLPPGTLVVVKPKPVEEIAIGDVMTYQIRPGESAVVSHRVTSVNSSSDGTFSFVTKGDNNSDSDPVVIEQQVQGVVWYSVPLIGSVANAVNGGQRAWVAPTVAVLLLGFGGVILLSGVAGAARRRRHPDGDSH